MTETIHRPSWVPPPRQQLHPALEGNTWPLRWYSAPSPTAPYVGAGALLSAVRSPG
ncbi:hypothetical protein [Streptomyces tendae]|uniref:hypothetical protein n=1 Tax=Streptomyces tendae TaxID=1932 RepID=UPI00364E0A8E